MRRLDFFRNSIWWSYIFFLFSFAELPAQLLSSETGTIIVTYQTDLEGERLDRIRFWLINENQERTLYPKKDEFVANHHSRVEKTVVISHLPIGKYTIQFLVPNADHYFDDANLRKVELATGAILRIDQAFQQRGTSEVDEQLALLDDGMLPLRQPLLPIIVINNPPLLPLPAGPLSLLPAKLSVNVNINVPWRLMRDGHIVYTGTGSVNSLPIPPARDYYLLAQDLPAYSTHIIPPNPFDAPSGQVVKIEIIYQHDLGYVELQGELPAGTNELTVQLLHELGQQPPIKVKIKSSNRTISWQSGGIATGEYLMILESPGDQLIEKRRFFLEKGKRTVIRYPVSFESAQKKDSGNLEVVADISQALYTLIDTNGVTVGQGHGYNYLFKQLSPGTYTIRFSSSDPRLFVPPPKEEVVVGAEKRLTVKAAYQKKGLLTIGSNVDEFVVQIESEESPSTIVTEKVQGRTKNVYLLEGSYKVTYEPLVPGSSSPKSSRVVVRSTSPQTVFQAYDSVSRMSIKGKT